MTVSTRIPALVVLAVAFCAGIVGTFFFRPDPPPPPPILAPTIALEKMGQIVSLRINYSDVIEFSEKTAVDLPFNREIRLGSTKALLVAKGDCTIATDMTRAKYANVEPGKRALTIALEMPQPLSVRINHSGRDKGGSYLYSITEHGLVRFIGDDGLRSKAADNVLNKAQTELTRMCTSEPNLANARQGAEAVLRTMYVATGWTPTFVWGRPTVAEPMPKATAGRR